MKKPIATCASIAGLGMLAPTSAQGAVVLAGWHTFHSATAPTVSVSQTDLAALISTSSTIGSWSTGESTSRGSSSDGTWGTSSDSPTPTTAAGTSTDQNMSLTNGKPSGELTFSLTNNGSDNMVLENFHFDAAAFRPSAALNYQLSVLAGGGITAGNVGTGGSVVNLGGTIPAGNDFHSDVDLALTGLSDNTLAPGESAQIRITWTGSGNGSNGGHHLFVDNIAFTGSIVPVPEPSTALLGLLGTGFFFLRRRR